ncbi:unnamed protein product [Rhizophagus irregularis]|uniref:Uncharacterized protein n=1 Tax=Rhizophagus irregularis TaxID=588596 RepID=A0A915YQS3_9GLOM|nr:unnamed protein product [Rhizophagus irregularis]
MTPLNILPSFGKIKPSDASDSKSHVTVLDKNGYNKKYLHRIRNIFAYSFQTHKLNPYIVSDTRGLRSKTTQRKGKDYKTVNFNPWKEVHSTRLGLKYNVIVKRYNEWKGKNNSDLKEVMEPITHNRKGKSTTRPFYKEYKNVEFYDYRTPQQVKRWNRLKKSTIKHEEFLYHSKPFLLKENSTVFKKVSHLVEREPSYEKSEEDKLLDQLTQKRAKNWRRRVNNRNKLKKKLPALPVNFSGDARNYYFQTYNINLFAYKVRRRYDLQPSPPQVISQPTQPQIDPLAHYALRRAQYEGARALATFHQNSTAFKTLAPLLVEPTLPPMVYPSAKEKARLNALANDDTPLPNSNQPTNDLLLRRIARPRSKKNTPSTDIVDNCNTPPPGPSRPTTDSPPRPIARPHRRINDLPPTPESDIYPFK